MTALLRAQRKSADDRRTDIVDAAMALLVGGGMAAVSTPAIAEAVGISQSAIFRHFRRKDDIWQAVMDRIGADVARQIGAAIASAGSRRDRLRAIVRAYVGVAVAVPALPALLFSGELHAAGGNAGLRDEILRRLGWLKLAIAEQLRAGREEGEFRADLDVPASADLAVGFVLGTLLQWRLGGEIAAGDDVDRRLAAFEQIL